MQERRWVAVSAVLVLSLGCGPVARMADAGPAEKVGAPRPSQGPALNEMPVTPASRADQSVRLPSLMIIRTGEATIEVDTLDRAVRQVTELASRFGGHIASSSLSTGANAPRTATLEIKMPADRYEGTIGGLSQIGTVRSAATHSEDVGEEFVDVTARVTNARRLEDRLLTVLATRTGKLEEVLGVERELARVREEIERYQGRLRYLTAQVAMSTLSVTVFEPGPIVGGPGENVIVTAFRAAWRNFMGVLAGVIAIAGGAVPIALLVGLGFLAVRSWLRRARPRLSVE